MLTSGQIVIRLDNLIMKDRFLSGSLYVTASGGDIKRGDKLATNGVLSQGFGNFVGVMLRYMVDVKEYLASLPWVTSKV